MLALVKKLLKGPLLLSCLVSSPLIWGPRGGPQEGYRDKKEYGLIENLRIRKKTPGGFGRAAGRLGKGGGPPAAAAPTERGAPKGSRSGGAREAPTCMHQQRLGTPGLPAEGTTPP